MTYRTFLALPLLAIVGVLIWGCPGGSLTVADDDDSQADDDDDAQGDDDDNQGDDDDTLGDDDDVADDDDAGDDDDDDNPFAGEYEGEVSMSVDTPQGPMVFSGPFLAQVSGNGTFGGGGEIQSPEAIVSVGVDGEVGPDGGFTGEALQSVPNQPPVGPFAADGEFAAGGFELRWTGEILTPDGQVMTFQGSAWGAPQ